MNEKLIAEEMKAVDQEIQERMKMSERDLKKLHRKKYPYNPGKNQNRRPPPFKQISNDQLEEITRNGKQERTNPEPYKLFRGKLAERQSR